MSNRPDYLYLFKPPYRVLVPIGHTSGLTQQHGTDGSAVVWAMGSDFDEGILRGLRRRPGGIALIVIAPPASEIETDDNLLRVLELSRPQALLPFHQEPSPLDLRALLQEPPESLSAAVVDYLAWRGLVLDMDTRHMLRRTIDLSAELRSISGLARGLYLSRRALGRRFMKEGLPVPSHWLHFSRLLRAVLLMQQKEQNLVAVSFRLGYPDAFAMSNQMKRLTDSRPSEISERLGWEWFVEAWIQEEVRSGGFGDDSIQLLHSRGAVLQRLDAGSDPQGSGSASVDEQILLEAKSA